MCWASRGPHADAQSNRKAAQALQKGTPSDQVAINSQIEYDKAKAVLDKGFEQAHGVLEKTLKLNRNAGQAKAPAWIASANILYSQALHLQLQHLHLLFQAF